MTTRLDRSIVLVAKICFVFAATLVWVGAGLISGAEAFRTHFRAADFIAYYAAGYMVRSGQTASLYDRAAVVELETEIAGPDHVVRPYIHPPFEAVIFSPLSILPYRFAYWVFVFLNLGAICASYCLLNPYLERMHGWPWVPTAIFAGFIPFLVALVQGQDCLFLLLILVGVQKCLDHGNQGWAGILLGVGMFRPQIVIPIVLVFALWRRWRVIAGFLLAASGATIVGLTGSGWSGTLVYVRRIAELGSETSVAVNETTYGIPVRYMGNLRGLLTMLLSGHVSGRTVLLSIAIVSSLVIVLAWMGSVRNFSTAILASSLVSYHFLVHDMAVLMIPIVAILGSALSSRKEIWAVIMLLGAQLITPYSPSHFLMAIPILVVFVLSARPFHSMFERQPSLRPA